MEVEYSHNVSGEEAAEIVDQTMKELEKNTEEIKSLKCKWNDDKRECKFVVNAMGFKIKGNGVVEPNKIVFTASLPFIAMAFSPDIQMIIDKVILKVSQGRVEKI